MPKSKTLIIKGFKGLNHIIFFGKSTDMLQIADFSAPQLMRAHCKKNALTVATRLTWKHKRK